MHDEESSQLTVKQSKMSPPIVFTVYSQFTLCFQQLVQQQRISGNQDSPEGGFDGFLQSLLCTEVSVFC